MGEGTESFGRDSPPFLLTDVGGRLKSKEVIEVLGVEKESPIGTFVLSRERSSFVNWEGSAGLKLFWH